MIKKFFAGYLLMSGLLISGSMFAMVQRSPRRARANRQAGDGHIKSFQQAAAEGLIQNPETGICDLSFSSANLSLSTVATESVRQFSSFSKWQEARELLVYYTSVVLKKHTKEGIFKELFNELDRRENSFDSCQDIIAFVEKSMEYHECLMGLRNMLEKSHYLKTELIGAYNLRLDDYENYLLECLASLTHIDPVLKSKLEVFETDIINATYNVGIDSVDLIRKQIHEALNHSLSTFHVQDFEVTYDNVNRHVNSVNECMNKGELPETSSITALVRTAKELSVLIKEQGDPGVSLKEQVNKIVKDSHQMSNPEEFEKILKEGDVKLTRLAALNLEDAQDSQVRCARFVAMARHLSQKNP